MNWRGIGELMMFALIMALILLCVHYCNRPPHIEAEYIIKHDTIVKTDTLTQYLPGPVKVVYKHDTLLQIIHETDTIEKIIPVVTAEYSDSNYHAVVSGGYFARLEQIDIYQRTNYITTTQANVVHRKPIISITAGIGVGYDPFRKNVAPIIGISVGVPIKNFYRK